jgi:hypothetical protein
VILRLLILSVRVAVAANGLTDVADKPTSVAELSCVFSPLDGVPTDYAGSANTLTGGFPPGKNLFMWRVVAVGDSARVRSGFNDSRLRIGSVGCRTRLMLPNRQAEKKPRPRVRL